jgi:hypothetical protein
MPGITKPGRFLFFIWWAVIVGVSSIWLCNWKNGKALFVAAALVVVALAGWRQAIAVTGSFTEKNAAFDLQSRYLWQLGEAGTLLPSPMFGQWGNHHNSILRIRELLGRGGSPPRVIYDEILLETGVTRGSHARFDHDCQCLVEYDPAVVLQGWRERLRPSVPLELQLSVERGMLRWQFGPYQVGHYAIVVLAPAEKRGVFPRTLHGEQKLGFEVRDDLVFRVRYDDPSGWITYSDVLVMSGGRQFVTWQRDGTR